MKVGQRIITDAAGLLDEYQRLGGYRVGSTRFIEPRRQPYPEGPGGLLMRFMRESNRDIFVTDVDHLLKTSNGDNPAALIELKAGESHPAWQLRLQANSARRLKVPGFRITWDGSNPETSEYEFYRFA